MNIRQFFVLLRQQRLFSGIYIVCTALSVALAMTLFLVLYIKFGPVYPEQDRARLAVMGEITISFKANGSQMKTPTCLAMGDTLRNIPEVECVTTFCDGNRMLFSHEVNTPGGESFPYKLWLVDENYWQVFHFRFLHGRGMTHDEIAGFSPVCVVSESLARNIFGRTDVLGCELEFHESRTDSIKRIIGVVEDVSPATPMTYGNLWVGIFPDLCDDTTPFFIGSFTHAMLLRQGCRVEQVQERMRQCQDRCNQEKSKMGVEFDWGNQPDPYWLSQFRSGLHADAKPFMRNIVYMLLAFLMIPAINMGSMVASRVGGRINEMGIRRAYGATRGQLVWQVLQENFLLTLIGGVLGLMISWLIMTLCADWLPFVFSPSDMELDEAAVIIRPDMMLSGWIVAAVLVVCLVLNIVSALLPTLWFLRKPITEEILHKQG